MFHIETMYGAHSKTGYVRIAWGAEDGIMTVPEARQHAQRILEVAANAEADEQFIRFLRERMGVTNDEQLAVIIRDFRAMRS